MLASTYSMLRMAARSLIIAIFALLLFATVSHAEFAPSLEAKKQIVFIAGRASHGYGSHEHYAGCRLLADLIEKAYPDVQCQVIKDGWPKDDSLLDTADTICIYADGGGGHPAMSHLESLKKQIDRGVGFVCLHYAVEVPKGPPGDLFKDWLGGYFETHWSVNPIWNAEFKELPTHEITRGVKPFTMFDEWYFHMRFRDNMTGVTPILSAVPPQSTMERPDGPHSGNPAVREEVARGDKQHVAWATERSNGGRSFGFTGGHFHWNWGRADQTRLVANAILWATKVELPEAGLPIDGLTMERLLVNQDEQPPANFDASKTAQEFGVPAGRPVTSRRRQSKLLYSSPVLTSQTPGQKVAAEVDIKDAKDLYLIVTPGLDGFACDWANWVDPVLVGPKGEMPLLDLKWKQATTGWGAVGKNANADGGPMSVRGQRVSGIGTHAPSMIAFDLPEGYETFKVTCALDDGGVNQNNGEATSVKFHVATGGVPGGLNDWGKDPAGSSEARDPKNAVAGLDVAEGLQATLSQSEPIIKSLTNIDIDHRGRVWVCEVVNYRGHRNDRPEGDRILILEDTNQDGIMDKTTVFYQGRDIDSALGLCVLGNRVLVSAAPYVLEFVDEDGDDVPDRKTAILTKTGEPQHDHSVHSFVFGPDGKLYFNFGNTGKQLCDKNGNPIKDRWGRDINDSGRPYRQGMVFRCNEDLSDMEVLGHNFRNNYEVAVDSFGALWQSDNDDDGNRATRINFVMEFGNYGYVDELTGAGWQVERANWEKEIPERHWHLNDPGVVPTMLLTGAGSPTGITVYEGDLLPKRFQNEVIHCDAGPNVVRAYPTTKDGAGYTATIENLLVGTRDRWFRPADVCVAPDGSLFVSDWYDPGVGGHHMEDMHRGRLFRLAPPNTKYVVPEYDYSTPEGATMALMNPNNSVRYLAYKSLVGMGGAAKPAVEKLAKHENPRMRARALWVLAKIADPAAVVEQALADADSDVRCTGIRIARQAGLATKTYMSKVLADSEANVLREGAIALREDTSPEMPAYWLTLASLYDGKDRWYLESLGIAATDRWDECLTMLQAKPLSNSKAMEGIIWRARGKHAAGMQAALLKQDSITEESVPALFRALDFQDRESRETALKSLLNLAP